MEAVMGVRLAVWRTKVLEVSAKKIEAFNELSHTTEVATEEKTSGKQSFARVKNMKPRTLTCTIPLYAVAGVDVNAEIAEWEALVDGKSAKIYVAGKALSAHKMMLTKVTVSERRYNAREENTGANVELTFTQGKSTSNGKSSKRGTKSTTTSAKKSTQIDLWDTLKGAVIKARDTIVGAKETSKTGGLVNWLRQPK